MSKHSLHWNKFQSNLNSVIYFFKRQIITYAQSSLFPSRHSKFLRTLTFYDTFMNIYCRDVSLYEVWRSVPCKGVNELPESVVKAEASRLTPHQSLVKGPKTRPIKTRESAAAILPCKVPRNCLHSATSLVRIARL